MTGCKYCSWIDPTRLEDDEVDGPLRYCRCCGRDLRVPGTVENAGQDSSLEWHYDTQKAMREAVLECYWSDGTSETRRVKVTDGFMKALNYWTELEAKAQDERD